MNFGGSLNMMRWNKAYKTQIAFLYQPITYLLKRLSLVLLFAIGMIAHSQAQDFLDPEVAFKVSAKMVEPGIAEVSYVIADGYYLYRERLKFDSADAKLGTPDIPRGKIKFDETFQKEVETYRHGLVVRIPVQAASDFTLNVGLQGCADLGLCYPPIVTPVKISIANIATATAQISSAGDPTSGQAVVSSNNKTAGKDDTDNDSNSISAALKSGRLILILPLFLLLGLGLSFTPCVLPMVPILSFIIVGEGANIKRSRGFVLSLSYVLGMALVYTVLGVAAGLIGEGLSAALQNPWVLGTFAALMVVLSLSMFDVYQLQVPAALQTKLSMASDGQKKGKLIGVFVMGAISALIVGPCVAAPLAGALLYISQTRDVVIGGSALFAMAIGMSVPLLLVGLSAGTLLPRAGKWMEEIKHFFGVLLIAMALWLVSPVIPAWAQMAGWALILMGYAAYQLFMHQGGKLSKAVAVLFAALGIAQLVGVSTGSRDVFAPLAHLYGEHVQEVKFVRVKSLAELDAALAQNKGKHAMLDFYADWCVSCKEMEKLTFPAPEIKRKLDTLLLLQVDVTANNADDKELLKRFHLFGPPGIIFFDQQGQEISDARVIGYQNPERFAKSLSKIH
jgi:thiol:disulfide interchange protein DsbD